MDRREGTLLMGTLLMNTLLIGTLLMGTLLMGTRRQGFPQNKVLVQSGARGLNLTILKHIECLSPNKPL